MIHWLRTIDYCFRFSFVYLTTYVHFLHFLDNEDRMSSKRRNLSALVFLINLGTFYPGIFDSNWWTAENLVCSLGIL